MPPLKIAKPAPGVWTWKASLLDRVRAWWWKYGREIIGAAMFFGYLALLGGMIWFAWAYTWVAP